MKKSVSIKRPAVGSNAGGYNHDYGFAFSDDIDDYYGSKKQRAADRQKKRKV